MIGQSVYQFIVLMIVIFAAAGPRCPGDEDPKTWVFEKGGLLDIESGIGRDHHADPTVHYTLVFNVFVFMQLFNWVNCRKLYHEPNAFAGIHTNSTFIIIWIICLVVQILLVEGVSLAGGSGTNKALKTQSLNGGMWGICLGCGFFTLLWQMVIILVSRFIKPFVSQEQDWKPVSAGSCNGTHLKTGGIASVVPVEPPQQESCISVSEGTTNSKDSSTGSPTRERQVTGGAISTTSHPSLASDDPTRERRGSKLGIFARGSQDKHLMSNLSAGHAKDEEKKAQSLHRTLSKCSTNPEQPRSP